MSSGRSKKTSKQRWVQRPPDHRPPRKTTRQASANPGRKGSPKKATSQASRARAKTAATSSARTKKASQRRPKVGASQKRGGKTTKQPTLWQKLKQWRPSLTAEVGPLKREAIGLGLLILAVLTLLGLSRISAGPVLGWWAKVVRQSFGWGAFLFALGLALAGVRLLWQDLRARLSVDLESVVGIELLFLVLLVASHLPVVSRLGADKAFVAAQQGRGGGYIGWALAAPLLKTFGVPVGVFILLLALGLGLFLVLSFSGRDILYWGRYRCRLAVAAISRWRIARQGTLVVPEPVEAPWWEQEPDLGDVRPAAGKPKAPPKSRPVRRRSKGAALPPLDLLNPASPHAYGDTDVRRKTQLIEDTLESFGVPAKVVEINRGPTVTQFGLDPGYTERRTSGGEVQLQRVRVGRIASLEKDLALALAAAPIRIEAPVPGRSVVGLEVPNENISLVSLRGVMESREFLGIESRLAIALGEDVSGRPVAIDLALMPHLLIAGATGSGKSVCINAIVCCLLSNNTAADLRLLMVDPKMVELTGYNGIPHLVAPVVVDVEQVVAALAWVTRQMDDRYKLFHKTKVRNLEEYNRRVGRRKDEEALPTLVVLVDELADLMMVAPDEVERHICRIAQMGRATGIHLVIATQRPSVDVVTGLIKANFPARISFAVTSQIDSRVILDQGGAENLLGRGDMLFMSPQQAAPIRLQGCFVSDEEIRRLTAFWQDHETAEEQPSLFSPWAGLEDASEADDLLEQAIEVTRGRKTISTSFIQRRLRVGFPRAARLVDQMADLGLVGPDEGAGRGRQVLIGRDVDLREIEERLPGVEPK